MRAIILSICILWTWPASAESTSETFLRYCSKWELTKASPDGGQQDIIDMAQCTSYLRGFNDAVRVQALGGRPTLYCMPEEALPSISQLSAILVKYLRDHPEKLHLHVSVNTLIAMREAFPCEQ